MKKSEAAEPMSCPVAVELNIVMENVRVWWRSSDVGERGIVRGGDVGERMCVMVIVEEAREILG